MGTKRGSELEAELTSYDRVLRVGRAHFHELHECGDVVAAYLEYDSLLPPVVGPQAYGDENGQSLEELLAMVVTDLEAEPVDVVCGDGGGKVT